MIVSLGVIGTKKINKKDVIFNYIDNWIKLNGKPDTIVSGDNIAEFAREYANNNNIRYIEYFPDWANLNNYASIICNQKIIDNTTHIIAFPCQENIRTYDIIHRAKLKGIPIETYYLTTI